MPRVEPFDTYTVRYDQWFERNRFAYEAEVKAIRRLWPTKGGVSIEIGVGTGRFAIPFAIKYGVDPSLAMVKVARQRGIEVVQAVAEALPFDAACVDNALMVTTICFVDDIEASLREAHRVVKPGGHLVIGFIDKDSPLGMMYQKHKDESVFYREATFYSVSGVVGFLQRVGFKEFAFAQTIFHALSEIQGPEPIREGYGDGSFVVIRAVR
jgi:ubiquinone/menaquinone biosynthesis C-methylase UbiE